MQIQMSEVANILEAVAWPAVALIVLFRFGAELRGLAERFGKRVEQAASIKLKVLGLGGLELAGLVARQNAVGAPNSTVGELGETAQQEFERLMAAYEAVDDRERADRVAKRDTIAKRLGELGNQLHLARSTLAHGPDVKIAALSSMVIADPRKGDLAHLVKAATKVEYKFSGYRLVLALLSFLATYPTSIRHLGKIMSLLDDIERRTRAGEDDDLTAVIEHTRRLVEAGAS